MDINKNEEYLTSIKNKSIHWFLSTGKKFLLNNDVIDFNFLLWKLRAMKRNMMTMKDYVELGGYIFKLLPEYYKHFEFCKNCLFFLTKIDYEIQKNDHLFYSELYLKIILYYEKVLSNSSMNEIILDNSYTNNLKFSDNSISYLHHLLINKLYCFPSSININTWFLSHLLTIFPERSFDNKNELQQAYFNSFLINDKFFNDNYYIFILCIIEKLLKNNILPKIDMNLFISSFFSKMTNLILNKNNRGNVLDELMYKIVTYLLFNDVCKPYWNITEKFFSIFLQKIIFFYGNNLIQLVSILKNYIIQFSVFMCDIKFDKIKLISRKTIFKYEENKERYHRFWYIMNNFFLKILKNFFFNPVKGSNFLLRCIFEVLSNCYIDYKLDLLQWFNTLYENIEINLILYFKNFQATLPFLLSQMNYPEVFQFLENSMKLIVRVIYRHDLKITGIILKSLPILYYHCARLKQTNYNKLFNPFFEYLDKEAINLLKQSLFVLEDTIPTRKLHEVFFFLFIQFFYSYLNLQKKQLKIHSLNTY